MCSFFTLRWCVVAFFQTLLLFHLFTHSAQNLKYSAKSFCSLAVRLALGVDRIRTPLAAYTFVRLAPGMSISEGV